MAWGATKHQAPPSTLSQVLPLVITATVLGAVAWVVYLMYVSMVRIQDQANKQMSSHNVVFTKDGVRVGVRQLGNENYVDATQSWFVKAWNMRGGPTDGGKPRRKMSSALNE